MQYSLTIVIVTYNSSKIIKDCLQSIVDNNDLGEKLEVIVVDNNSNDLDATNAIFDEFNQPNWKFIANTKNGGYGQGNNVGIKEASSPYILIMNPDVMLYKPIFKSAIGFLDANRNVAILGITQYERNLKDSHSYFPLRMNFRNLIRYKIHKMIGHYSQRLFCIHGACFFIRKESFEEVGLFDENIFLYGEEIDIHTRLTRAGHKIKFRHDLGYIHPQHDREFSLKLAETGLKSQLYLCEKFGWNPANAIRDEISTLKALRFKSKIRGKKISPLINERISQLKNRL